MRGESVPVRWIVAPDGVGYVQDPPSPELEPLVPGRYAVSIPRGTKNCYEHIDCLPLADANGWNLFSHTGWCSLCLSADHRLPECPHFPLHHVVVCRATSAQVFCVNFSTQATNTPAATVGHAAEALAQLFATTPAEMLFVVGTRVLFEDDLCDECGFVPGNIVYLHLPQPQVESFGPLKGGISIADNALRANPFHNAIFQHVDDRARLLHVAAVELAAHKARLAQLLHTGSDGILPLRLSAIEKESILAEAAIADTRQSLLHWNQFIGPSQLMAVQSSCFNSTPGTVAACAHHFEMATVTTHPAKASAAADSDKDGQPPCPAALPALPTTPVARALSFSDSACSADSDVEHDDDVDNDDETERNTGETVASVGVEISGHRSAHRELHMHPVVERSNRAAPKSKPKPKAKSSNRTNKTQQIPRDEKQQKQQQQNSRCPQPPMKALVKLSQRLSHPRDTTTARQAEQLIGTRQQRPAPPKSAPRAKAAAAKQKSKEKKKLREAAEDEALLKNAIQSNAQASLPDRELDFPSIQQIDEYCQERHRARSQVAPASKTKQRLEELLRRAADDADEFVFTDFCDFSPQEQLLLCDNYLWSSMKSLVQCTQDLFLRHRMLICAMYQAAKNLADPIEQYIWEQKIQLFDLLNLSPIASPTIDSCRHAVQVLSRFLQLKVVDRCLLETLFLTLVLVRPSVSDFRHLRRLLAEAGYPRIGAHVLSVFVGNPESKELKAALAWKATLDARPSGGALSQLFSAEEIDDVDCRVEQFCNVHRFVHSLRENPNPAIRQEVVCPSSVAGCGGEFFRFFDYPSAGEDDDGFSEPV